MKSFQQLKAELDAGTTSNLYIFTGEEKEVMSKYIKRIDANARRASSLQSILPTLRSNHLFNFAKTFVIDNDKDVLNYSIGELIELSSQNRIIIIFDKADNRQKFFKNAEDFHTEFTKFTDSQLVQYIQKLIPEMSAEVAQVFARYCNNEVSRIELEVDKLNRLQIQSYTIELLNEIITPPAEDQIFEMIDSVAKKKKERAFDLYQDLIELKESPIKIVSLLYTKFKQVFLVQSYFNLSNVELAGKTGLTFYQVNFARELAGNFSNERLTEILKLIQQTEVYMKTGERDINHAMDSLLIDILS